MIAGDFERLSQSLTTIGWTWWSLGDEASGRLIVTERGARVLGLFPGMQGDNAIWVNPKLYEQDGARDWDGVWNSGGDRTWAAPEINFFIQRTDEGRAYEVQPDLDPGRYKLVRRSDSRCTLVQNTQIQDHERGQRVPVSIERDVKLIPSPFHEQGYGAWSEGEVAYAGYELRVRLGVLGDYPHPIGIWNLLQVPAPGTIYVPTWHGVEPTVIFGDPEPVVLMVEGGGTRFEVDGRNQCKVSIPAVSAMGRLSFRRELSNGASSLLVRNIGINPSGVYADTPWDAPEDRGYAVQCYGDDGALGAFGEMEYHAPALLWENETDGGVRMCVDVSQLWCFVGPRSAIDAIARQLLGASASLYERS